MVGFGCRASHSSRILATYFAESAASVKLANSASVILRATNVYFFVFYTTSALATNTTWLLIECYNGIWSAKEASINVSINRSIVARSRPLNSRLRFAIPFKYRKKCFIRSR